MVEEDGFEPSKSLTTDLQSAPFGHSGTPPYLGAGDGTRTRNLLITSQLLFQLSYTSLLKYTKHLIIPVNQALTSLLTHTSIKEYRFIVNPFLKRDLCQFLFLAKYGRNLPNDLESHKSKGQHYSRPICPVMPLPNRFYPLDFMLH